MSTAKVEVATAALLRAWRKVNCTELWLQFRPRRQGDVMAEVAEAVWDTNGLFDEEDPDSDFVFGEGPWEVPIGRRAYLVVLSRTTYEPGVIRWLEGFAEHLTGAGVAGRVGATPATHPSWAMVDRIPSPDLTAFLAYSVLDPAPPRDRPFEWNVSDETTARIAAHVEHLAFPEAETFLWRKGPIRADPAVAAAALRRMLPRDCITAVAHLRPDPPRFVNMGFYCNGQSIRMVYDPQQSWEERLVQCIDTITALPEATELAFVQYASGRGFGWDTLDASRPALPGTRESHFLYNPHLLGRFVPDARGVMLLTDAHLDRAHDLSDWSIEPLGHGRHLVKARNLAAWYAQPEPPPEVLEQARADFGPMILTVADIEQNPPPSSA